MPRKRKEHEEEEEIVEPYLLENPDFDLARLLVLQEMGSWEQDERWRGYVAHLTTKKQIKARNGR